MTVKMIAFKGTVGDFRALRTVYNSWPGRNRVQMTCDTSSAYHVQHVVCHVVQRDRSAIKFGRIEIAFFNWLRPLTDEGREEGGVLGENP